ncbi:MAG: hypothetical protein LBV12_03735 [Puniceicoccales bacterium]|jgi:hypothetical protein|nr:hypothetical protein [Puniceicoccales bacterium]
MDNSRLKSFFLGIIVPCLLLSMGIHHVIVKTFLLVRIRTRSRIYIEGTPAQLLGLMLICVAIALHINYFWGLRAAEDGSEKYEVGAKIFAGIAILCALGALFLALSGG